MESSRSIYWIGYLNKQSPTKPSSYFEGGFVALCNCVAIENIFNRQIYVLTICYYVVVSIQKTLNELELSYYGQAKGEYHVDRSHGQRKKLLINALFDMNVAKVGTGVDPETTCISKFESDNLVILDTPGLGDGIEDGARITKDIIKKLNEMDERGNPFIDVVLVISDASSKDLGPSYDLFATAQDIPRRMAGSVSRII